MPLARLKESLKKCELSPMYGTIHKITATNIVAKGLKCSIGDIVRMVKCDSLLENLGMVVSVEDETFNISPFSFVEGFSVGDKVYLDNRGLSVPVGEGLLGRVVNPLGEPIDGKGFLSYSENYPMIRPPIRAMDRGMIDAVFSVGVRTIDSFLTCGKGQKLGVFAGSGVGKSTLMGMIVKGSKAKIKVIALIGERGREVPEFIEKNLGGDLKDTVIVVATSDDSPLMRKYGAFSAMSIAEYFKDRGDDVLFMMDSVTRFAMAQREIGLALGEPPTSKGYPPSVMALLPQLMERAGKERNKGSITAFFTVLVEGDDMNDPIADQSRSILDGHIVLSRELTDFGIYPPINILNSASRVMSDVTNEEHIRAATKFRRLYALLKDNEVLIRIGAYTKGADKELDESMAKKDSMNNFLKQDFREVSDFEESVQNLINLMK